MRNRVLLSAAGVEEDRTSTVHGERRNGRDGPNVEPLETEAAVTETTAAAAGSAARSSEVTMRARTPSFFLSSSS